MPFLPFSKTSNTDFTLKSVTAEVSKNNKFSFNAKFYASSFFTFLIDESYSTRSTLFPTNIITIFF